MYPSPQIVSRSDEPVRCAFYTLAIRTDALRERYKGGIRAFASLYKPQFGTGLAILCAMVDEDLCDPTLDIKRNGLKEERDFVCFDAAKKALSLKMLRELGVKMESDVKFAVPWLTGYVENGGVMVEWRSTTEDTS
jgi:hypothetical protein